MAEGSNPGAGVVVSGKKRKKGEKHSRDEDPQSALLRLAGEKTDSKSPAEQEAGRLAKKYRRGQGPSFKRLPDKKLKATLKATEKLHGEAAITAAKVEQWLLPSEGGFLEAEGVERTSNFQQSAIVKEVDLLSSRKAFDVRLPELGPYSLDYTRNGRHLLMAGRKGHLAITEWKRGHIVTEVQVRETIRDVKFLHNEVFFAAAQKKYAYIYDKRGIEIHCLKHHTEPLKLEFLPHHFLLASVCKWGGLVYQDTSTGDLVAQHRTRLGRCSVIRANPYNAVLSLGHSNGVVSMWSPNMGTPLVSMLCHRGPLTSIAIDSLGRYMATAGLDGQVKVWDIRMLKPMHAYFAPSPAKSLEISQKGLLAVAYGSGIQIWKDALSQKQKFPYMTHRVFDSGAAEDMAFCPYEDVLGIGHSLGFSSILVPGSGEANYDSFVANPFETLKQRRETEVHQLLDKLQPDTIVLDPTLIGTVQRAPREVQEKARQQQEQANLASAIARGKEIAQKHKSKGKSKPSKKHRKKQTNVIDAKREKISLDARLKAEAANKQTEKKEKLGGALGRFAKR